MAPGPKKRNFHTPRNAKNTQVSKSNKDQKDVDSNNEVNKNVDINSNVSSVVELPQKDKYSKRNVESNWVKYEEPEADRYGDSMRGSDFNVLLSYSGGTGSQLKLQDEKEWEDEFTKDISLDIKDLISAMKCIPFHERISIENIFSDKVVANFVTVAKKHAMSYKPPSNSMALESADLEKMPVDTALNFIEEPASQDSDDDIPVKSVTVQDKTEDIINTLSSNLTFNTFSEQEETKEVSEAAVAEEINHETTSSDLDFLLSLNISSKVSTKEETVSVAKNTNVDDWLNSLLDD